MKKDLYGNKNTTSLVQLLPTYSVIVLLFGLSCLPVCCSEGENYEKILVRKLLEDYDTAVRPSRNITVPLNVTFGLALTQIIDVDERNQILTTNCWLNQQWIDYGLKWNPADYGGIKQIRIPAEKVWRPDIILYNNADSQYNLAILSTNVIVNSEGNLTWLSTAIFKSSCQINVEYFPFDEQNCTMKFSSWTYDGFQINLLIQTEDGDLSNYVANGEWSLIAMRVKRNVVYYSCCPDEPYPDITYMIILRRRPLFYVFNLILPCVLISGLALLSFYMPSDSGEKVTLGITTLLSMTVFLMVIGESMPPTSEKLPLIGLYYGVTISLVSFATGLSVVTLNIHHRGMRGRELPSYMRRFLFDYLAKVLFLKLEMPKRAYLFTGRLSSRTKERSIRSCSVDERFLSTYTDGPYQSSSKNDYKTSNGVRELPETWRIVYPDMPATPPNSNVENSKRFNHAVPVRETKKFNQEGNSYRKETTDVNASRLRPVVRVRGMPNAIDLALRVNTLSECFQMCDRRGAGSHVPSNYDHRNCHLPFQMKARHHHQPDLEFDDLSQSVADATGVQDSDEITKADLDETGNPNKNPTKWQRELIALLHKVNSNLEKNENRMDEHERKDILKLEWQQAALVIDRLLLWIFVVTTVAATFGILYKSPHTKLFTN